MLNLSKVDHLNILEASLVPFSKKIKYFAAILLNMKRKSKLSIKSLMTVKMRNFLFTAPNVPLISFKKDSK